jgi:hypothetical protein
MYVLYSKLAGPTYVFHRPTVGWYRFHNDLYTSGVLVLRGFLTELCARLGCMNYEQLTVSSTAGVLIQT